MVLPLQQFVLLECTNNPPRLRRHPSTSVSSLLRYLQIRFPWDGWKCSCVTERGVTERHREPERQKRRLLHIFSIPKHCFVVKQLNKTLFCRDAYFLSKITKIFAMSQKKWLQVRWKPAPHFFPLAVWSCDVFILKTLPKKGPICHVIIRLVLYRLSPPTPTPHWKNCESLEMSQIEGKIV